MLQFVFAFFSNFPYSISHSSVMHLCQRFHYCTCTQDSEIWYKHWILQVILCKKESASSFLSFPRFAHFLSLQLYFFSPDFSAPMRTRVFKKVLCVQEYHDAGIYLALFSISHSSVMHRENCVKDLSGI